MANMGYCRFQNTLEDLIDCYENMDDEEELSQEERRARDRLVRVCSNIVFEHGNNEEK